MKKDPVERTKVERTRRDFLQTSIATSAAIAGSCLLAPVARGQSPRVIVVVDRTDPVLQQAPVQWALEELRESLTAKGIPTERRENLNSLPSGAETVVVARPGSSLAGPLFEGAKAPIPAAPESLALVRGPRGTRSTTLLSGADERGLVYAVLELSDRVALLGAAAFGRMETVSESPANPIRSVTRNFQSDLEDKPWFNDQDFWKSYLSMLVAQRFNRFSLAFGLGYNRPHDVHDAYFYFTYPFLFTVPGYAVKVKGLSDNERDRNLEMLRWIGRETVARGLHFQLALWNHAYQWIDSPDANLTIEGLNPGNHAFYCRDALQNLLEECPEIQGVTLRAHSESGIPEGSYEFWEALFEGIRRSGRRIEIDIHSKGIEHRLLEMALKTGNPIVVSPKYWAEHMGLPYHQASIREMERVPPPDQDRGDIETQRRFTRYGYGDYLREDRKYGVLYRIWPGTQRTLLWGDPATAAGYGRYSHFCGSLGTELCEPLSFKGRMGSGRPGGRNAYADPSLRPEGGDWKKHAYTYRLWGRLLYNPDAQPESWRRYLEVEFGSAARSCEDALSRASRVLPLITVAHHPSASNNRYWPEIYTDMPIVDPERSQTYRDTPSPRRFGTVSSLDPVLFSSVKEFTEGLLGSQPSGKYTPLDVARWLEGDAQASLGHLETARGEVARKKDASFRRLEIDVSIQSALGSFYAEKLRAAVAYELFQSTAEEKFIDRALEHCRKALEAWKSIIQVSEPAYFADITYGRDPHLRGHWKDRIAAMEEDLKSMERSRASAQGSAKAKPPRAFPKIDLDALFAGSDKPRPRCEHLPPAAFAPGKPLKIVMTLESAYEVDEVRIYFRRVNQEEAYRIERMSLVDHHYEKEIPSQYTDSPYPLEYFFELVDQQEAWIYPGFRSDLTNQPYFAVRQA